MMKRREFITLLGGAAAAWPLVVRAQQAERVRRIGFLGLAPASASASRLEALRSGLRDLGYVEGKNIVLEFRWADSTAQLAGLAAELVRMNVDVIFAQSSTMVEAGRQATKTIPIVFAIHADPVGLGHVASLARPGGNITGLSMLLTDLVVKELEILKEALPHATRIGVLWNPTTPSHPLVLKAVEAAGEKLGVLLHMAPARTVADIGEAFSSMRQERLDGFLLLGSPLFSAQRATLGELALKQRLPGMFSLKEDVEAGGLISYSADTLDLFRRSAFYIDRILKGEKPADLPVQQPTRFQLVINLKTAKALGLEVPPTLLTRADEVIE
jgi:putative tryptophan/tyrosine transport system substrate-binding protein